MGSIPLAANNIQPPPNPMQELARIFQIRGLQQQQQLGQQQQQLNQLAINRAQLESADDEKWRSAMRDPNWDGTPEQLLKNGLKQGVGPQSYANVAQGMAKMGEGFANLGSAQLKLQDALANHIGDQLQAVSDAKPQDKLAAQQQAKQNAITWITSTPGIHPAVRQQQLAGIQQIPDDVYIGDDAIQDLIARNKFHSAIVEEGLKKAQTAEAAGKGAQSAAEAAKVTGEGNPSSPFYSPTPAYLQNQAAGGPNVDANAQAGAQNILAGQAKQAGAVAGAEAQAKLPYEVEARKQAAIAAVQAQAQMYAGNSALAKVPPHLVPAATSEATKLGTDYATLSGQLMNLRSQLAAAKTGDEVAAAFAPVATALGSNSFYGTHRLAPAEVAALGPQLGSVGRQINTWFDKATKGQMPDASLREFAGLVDRLSDAAETKYRNGLAVVNQNYGSSFQPVQMKTAGKSDPLGIR